MNYRFTSRSELETMEFAENLESEKFPGMVICLDGELGSGKTVFVKGFAKALGINETITSPTFSLVKEYMEGEMPLYHMDVYRLDDSNDEFGLSDYLNQDGVCIIEWPEMIENQLPDERLDIKFKVVGDNTRVLVITPYGQKYEDLCEAVL
ncbi:MAG TPA: tRNA (adenosine(37)-N6)-threonylcarbamoyltransferase complex ATPase subunit type 1 TsaE [Firmicutes bacterium]|nr:tRNA (adenosine(37)-N6)-threonylcarbamoyltransferase complex ATPase subunit type 1 TsaE [Bacillota bacterium]